MTLPVLDELTSNMSADTVIKLYQLGYAERCLKHISWLRHYVWSIKDHSYQCQQRLWNRGLLTVCSKLAYDDFLHYQHIKPDNIGCFWQESIIIFIALFSYDCFIASPILRMYSSINIVCLGLHVSELVLYSLSIYETRTANASLWLTLPLLVLVSLVHQIYCKW